MHLGLWETVGLMIAFSVLVIVMDEIIHARRRRAKQKDGSGSAIPIKIGGSRTAPDFGLDVRRVFRRGS